MNIIVFTIAAALSLPKQFAILYIGFILKADADSELFVNNAYRRYVINPAFLVLRSDGFIPQEYADFIDFGYCYDRCSHCGNDFHTNTDQQS